MLVEEVVLVEVVLVDVVLDDVVLVEVVLGGNPDVGVEVTGDAVIVVVVVVGVVEEEVEVVPSDVEAVTLCDTQLSVSATSARSGAGSPARTSASERARWVVAPAGTSAGE